MKSFHSLFLVLLLSIVFNLKAQATHFIGGGFEYQYIGQNQIKLKLKMYRDPTAGGALFEEILLVSIRRKTNHGILKNTSLKLMKLDTVKSGSLCAGTTNITEIAYYEDTIQLDSTFNHFAGYYLTWERCCRVNGVNNIYDSGSTPITFYLDLPELKFQSNYLKNYSPEIDFNYNSSVYINDTIRLNFNVFDKENDSVVIKLNKIISGIATSTFDPTQKSPSYPLVFADWESNHSIDSPIQNYYFDFNSMEGYLDIHAKNLGFSALAFEILEYRNGILISKSNREFTFNFKNYSDFFTQQPKDIRSISNNVVLFNVRHNAYNPQYQWQVKEANANNFQDIPNTNNDTLEFIYDASMLNNRYRCIVISDSMLCGDTSNVVGIYIPLSISNQNYEKFNIFPNPAQSVIHLQNANKIKSLEVLDLYGKLYNVYLNEQTIYIKELGIGIYFLKIKDLENRVFYKKFIKVE